MTANLNWTLLLTLLKRNERCYGNTFFNCACSTSKTDIIKIFQVVLKEDRIFFFNAIETLCNRLKIVTEKRYASASNKPSSDVY
jgi:hypothetical protein